MTWDCLSAAVAGARALIAAAAPDPAIAAEGEAYVARVAAAGLGAAVLGHLLQEDGLARPLPCHGGPNPDYIMRHAPVDGARTYRLEGELNGSERVGVGLYRIGPNGAPVTMGYRVFDPARCGPGGRFALTIAAGAEGEGTLAIGEGARVLLIRVLHRDPAAPPARLRLSGGAQPRDLALTTGTADGALGFVAQGLANSVREYLKWTAAVSAHPNRFAEAPPELAETVQGDPDTRYYLGSFDLAPGEHLAVTMPADVSGYWSVNAYNHWFEHLQTPGVHDRNAITDADGRLRLAIGPGTGARMANRIDTLGRPRGALICRIIGTGACPEARVAR
jgi:hypothetical protein